MENTEFMPMSQIKEFKGEDKTNLIERIRSTFDALTWKEKKEEIKQALHQALEVKKEIDDKNDTYSGLLWHLEVFGMSKKTSKAIIDIRMESENEISFPPEDMKELIGDKK